MRHRVVLQRLAQDDLAEAYRRAAANAPGAAARWLQRFEIALATLEDHPDRCPRAREDAKVPLDIREFLFGRRPHVFRVLFTIEHQTVRILRIIRAQRRFLTRRQIDDAAGAGE